MLSARTVLIFFLVALVAGCISKRRLGRANDMCSDDSDCVDGLCWEGRCLDPDGDEDHDGLLNGEERNLCKTSPLLADSDGDGRADPDEVGPDLKRPLDSDGDGLADAVESALPSADPDRDCLPDQYDPHNNEPDQAEMSTLVMVHCRTVGVCGQNLDKIVASCADGVPGCDYHAVPGYEATEISCDGKDNDCDGQTDVELSPPANTCLSVGVCSAGGAEASCESGAWVCSYAKVQGYEKDEATCDGKDNDCDGQTDEDLKGVPCKKENAYGACEGTTVCTVSGATECNAPDAEVEVCDGADNDCDGQTDEDEVCTKTARISGVVRHFEARPEVTGAKVEAFDENGCEYLLSGAEPQGGPEGSAVTDDSGHFAVPVKPGIYCVRVSAPGYQSAVTWSIHVSEQEDFPLVFALTKEGDKNYALSVCGSASHSGQALPGVNVILYDEQSNQLGTTTSDTHGHWCFDDPVPLIKLGTSMRFSVAAFMSGYLPTSFNAIASKNVVPIVPFDMQKVPAETICLTADFEDCDLTKGQCPGWSTDEPVDNTGWWPYDAKFASEEKNDALVGMCASMAKDEDCTNGSGGCALCSDHGCVPTPGALPHPVSGLNAFWFGTSGRGNYLGLDGQCIDVPGGNGTPVSGGLVSPWIDAKEAVSLKLEFSTAWEVEGVSPKWADQMRVEVQVADSAAWNQVLTLNADAPDGTDPYVGWSSGGLGMSPKWQTVQVDLAQFVKHQVRFRFYFDSVDGQRNAFRGWFVDKVVVTGAGCKQQF